MVQIKKKTASMWECKVGNNANIANFMCLSKNRMGLTNKIYRYKNNRSESQIS